MGRNKGTQIHCNVQNVKKYANVLSFHEQLTKLNVHNNIRDNKKNDIIFLINVVLEGI